MAMLASVSCIGQQSKQWHLLSCCPRSQGKYNQYNILSCVKEH
jgi:hypothetical protein